MALASCQAGYADPGAPATPDSALFGAPADFQPLPDPLSGLLMREVGESASKVIGPDGGSVELIGHRIDVPAGAVGAPTRFTLTVIPERAEVELEATADGMLGTVTNVGKRGFRVPVRVTMSYERTRFANNPPGVDHLSILRVVSRLGYAKSEPVPVVVNEAARTVSAELESFSRFALASPY
jgi:hypothetical protein